MTRVLVTGGNGFIGSHLVERLVSRGDDVTCLVRRTSNVDRIAPLGVRLIHGDTTDRDSLSDAVAGQRVVFHVAGCTRALSAERLFQINTDGARNIAEACAAQADPPVLVMVSSLAASGPSRDGRPRIESDPPAPVSQYGRSKLAGERAIGERADTVPATIVRPPIVLGEADVAGLDLFRSVVRWRVHMNPSLRRTITSVIHAADLAELLVRAAERGERLPATVSPDQSPPDGRGIYHAVADEQPSYAELGRRIARVAGRRVLVIPNSKPAVYAAAAGAELIGRLRHRAPYLGIDKAHEATGGHWVAAGEKARRQLNFRPAASLDDRLRQTLEWYRREGWL